MWYELVSQQNMTLPAEVTMGLQIHTDGKIFISKAKTYGWKSAKKKEKKLEQVSRGSRIPPASVAALYIN